MQVAGRIYAGFSIGSIERALRRVSARKLLAIVLLINILGSVYWALDRQQGLQDLGSFLHSGAAHREGLNPYGYYPYVQPQPISPDALNLNPPITVYPFEALSRADPTVLRYTFLVATAASFAVALLLLQRAYPDKKDPLVVLAFISMAGLWHIFGYLQLYAPLFLAVVGAWLLMTRGNTVGAAILIGLVVAIKPNFVLWPAFLLLAGHQRMGLVALGTTAAVSAVPFILDGPEIYSRWLSLSLAFDGLQWASNASIMSMGARVGLPTAGYVAGCLTILALLALHWRLRPSALDSSTLGIIAALLFGPASWAGYTLFLVPYLCSRRWSSSVWVAVLLLCTPFWLMHYMTGASPLTNALVGPLYGWAVLLLLGIVVARLLNLSAAERGLASRMAVLFGSGAKLREAEPAA